MMQKPSSDHPQPPYILALDVGTSSTRTLLVDAAGNTLPHVLAQRALCWLLELSVLKRGS
jgi:2-keto-3-deoxy-galactonokinase